MAGIRLKPLLILAFVPASYSWFLFDRIGCHVLSTTGMCGACTGGCWPYYKDEGASCGYCSRCKECDNGQKMDELCRCTDGCPLGKYGSNCDKNCEYKCRACDRNTGKCLVWCSWLCLDTCNLSTGICRYNMTVVSSCGTYGKDRCEQYSRYRVTG